MPKKILSVKVEKEKLARAVEKLIKTAPTEAKKIILSAAEMFALSATKETPPTPGRSIPMKKYKREIIKRKDGEISRGDRIKNKLGRAAAILYVVKYRNSKKQGVKTFFNLRAAKEFAKITYRGIGRAGWFLALLKLGKSLTSAHSAILDRSPRIPGKTPNVTTVTGGSSPRVSITNQAEGIARYATRSEAWGLSKAKNRVNQLLKIYAKEQEAKWRRTA